MTAKQLVSEIEKMDRKSDDFVEVFATVNEMFFTFDDPDAFQKRREF